MGGVWFPEICPLDINYKTIVSLLHYTWIVTTSPFYTAGIKLKYLNMPLESASVKNKVLSTISCSKKYFLSLIHNANLLPVQYE